MSTKSKRRIARRSGNATETIPTSQREVAGQIVGALLSAITFGAVDGPQSARGRESGETPGNGPTSSTSDAPHPV